jgi:hypothetical protein
MVVTVIQVLNSVRAVAVVLAQMVTLELLIIQVMVGLALPVQLLVHQ